MSTPAPAGPRRLPGILIGVGMGGFVDGIVLHQILHWHQMGSSVVPPVDAQAILRNMRWDGLFHAVTWGFVLAGILLLWREGRAARPLPTGAALAGQMILGWGLFNLVEGQINHQLLGLHHVRDVPVYVPYYDWIFLALGGGALILLGLILMRRGRGPSPVAHRDGTGL